MSSRAPRAIGDLRRALGAGMILCFLVAPVAPAMAQAATQEELFAAMLADPANPDVMLAYARAAAQARDFEGAVSTLERLLDADPANQDARLDLARAYAALGVRGAARYHVGLYLDRGDLTPAERSAAQRIAGVLEEPAGRVSLRGSYEAGVAHRTEDGSTGLSVGLSLSATHDLGGAVTHTWDTDLRLRGYTLGDDDDDTRLRLVLRTGPALALDGSAFGARLRPYLGIETTVDDTLADEGTSASLGLAYDNPVLPQLGIFASVESGRLWRPDGEDADRLQGLLGATWRPVSGLSLRLSGRYTEEVGQSASLIRDGARLDVTWRFDPGIAAAAKPWALSGFGQVDREDFSSGRDDDVTAYGLRLRAFWTDALFSEFSVRRLERTSSIDALDDSENILSLTIGRTF